MADTIVKFIPQKCFFASEENKLRHIMTYLKNNIPADSITCRNSKYPEFVDGGDGLKEILCPKCNKIIDFKWWNNAVSSATIHQFSEIIIRTPCCGKRTDLNSLKYNVSCAISRLEIIIINPKKENMDEIKCYLSGQYQEIFQIIRYQRYP